MKVKVITLIGFLLYSIFFRGEVGAASDKIKKQPPEAVSEQPPVKQETPVDEPDELQKQYLARLEKINYRLKGAHITFLKNYRLSEVQDKLEMLKLRSLGRIPLDVKMQRQELKDEEIRTEASIKNLDEEKENLKLDALKFYSGEIPKWLSEKWQEEENNHKNYIGEQYKKILGR